jgi:hypothetical protein
MINLTREQFNDLSHGTRAEISGPERPSKLLEKNSDGLLRLDAERQNGA